MTKRVCLLFWLCLIAGAEAKTLPLDKPRSILKNIYLRSGIGAMMFRTFQARENSYLNKAPKSSPMFHVGIGYRFSDALRADLIVFHSQVKYAARHIEDDIERGLTQKAKSTSVMLNGYYDINVSNTFGPYLTVGSGLGRSKAGDMLGLLSEHDLKWAGKGATTFVWNAGVGLSAYLRNSTCSIDFGYRYMYLGKISARAGDLSGGSQKLRGNQWLISFICSGK